MNLPRLLAILLHSLCALTSLAEPLPVGVSLPLTGPAATYGADLQNIFNYLNKKIGAGRFTLDFQDDRCDSREAVNIAQKFARVDKHSFVIGLPCSAAAIAAAPIYEASKVLAIVTLAGSPKISKSGDYIFRTRPTDISASGELNRYITAKHSSLAVIVEQTEYAIGMFEAFEAAGLPKDFKIYKEEFASSSTDFRSSILKLRSKKPDALLILPQSEQSLLMVVKQVKDLNWNLQLYSNWVAESPTFLSSAGKIAENIIYPTLPHYINPQNQEQLKLYNDFTSEFGALKSIRGSFECAYNTFAALISASEKSEDPRSNLYNSSISGFNGDFSFDSNGDIVGMAFSMHVNTEAGQKRL